MRDIVADELKIGLVQKVHHIDFLAGEKVVHANHVMLLRHQTFAQMGPEEAGAPGDENSFCFRHGISKWNLAAGQYAR